MENREQTQEIARQEETKAQEFLTLANAAEVTNQVQNEAGAAFLKTIKGFFATNETARKNLVTPLNNHVKWINGQFKPSNDVALRAEAVIKKKLADYELKRRQIAAQEEARLRDAADKQRQKDLDAATKLEAAGKHQQAEAKREKAEMAPTPAVMEAPPIKGLSFSEEITIEIVDSKLVPFEYWLIDRAKVLAYAKATNGEIEIPGVRILKGIGVASGKM